MMEYTSVAADPFFDPHHRGGPVLSNALWKGNGGWVETKSAAQNHSSIPFV
jgi:hypothetical protein